MAKGGQRYKNMGVKASGKDERTNKAANLTAKHVGATSRGGAMKKKTDYKRKAKHAGKMYEGKSFIGFLQETTSSQHDTVVSVTAKIDQLEIAMESTDDQAVVDTLKASFDELMQRLAALKSK